MIASVDQLLDAWFSLLSPLRRFSKPNTHLKLRKVILINLVLCVHYKRDQNEEKETGGGLYSEPIISHRAQNDKELWVTVIVPDLDDFSVDLSDEGRTLIW